MCTGSSSYTVCRRSMRSTAAHWRCVSTAGASAPSHAGWKFGWRDAPLPGDPGRRYVETYCYAFAGPDFLEDETQQLYWRSDIVQMTRYFMIEAAHSGIRLSPRHARFPL